MVTSSGTGIQAPLFTSSQVGAICTTDDFNSLKQYFRSGDSKPYNNTQYTLSSALKNAQS